MATLPLQADKFIGFDNYKQLYFIKDNILHKQGSEGVYVYSDFQLGKIASVDIINPLKIVIFYETVNTVVFVDNRLNEIERINFNNLPQFVTVSTATNAGNNLLWIFNVDTQQLELFDYRSNRKTIVSQPFSGKLLSQASNFNYCFMLTERMLRAFNVYGSLLSEMEAMNFEKIIQQNEKVLALKANALYTIQMLPKENSEKTIHPIKIELPENPIKDLQLSQDLLYIYDGINILTFSLTPPKQ
ncbi:hypothetical protein [Altibacter sp.]|uniref:hypothetical protein n=1 Tax=Altibacter sp. TaxID=2024823 RepID=UPI0025C24B51|nr:hypothetical protein [Altibacter sp.]